MWVAERCALIGPRNSLAELMGESRAPACAPAQGASPNRTRPKRDPLHYVKVP